MVELHDSQSGLFGKECEFNEWTGKSDSKPMACGRQRTEKTLLHISSTSSSIHKSMKIKQEFHSLGKSMPLFSLP